MVASHFDKINRSKRSIRDLLFVVRDEIIVELDKYVIKLHKEVLAKQRRALRQFCDSKCSNGQSIMNFTDHKIPEKLLLHLKHGLKNTPAIEVQVDRLRDELLEEAVNFCQLMYHSYYGVYPRTQMTDTFDNYVTAQLI